MTYEHQRQQQVTSHLDDEPPGRQTSGRQTKPTERQPTGRHILLNWATEVETTGPQLWKCERVMIAVLEQLCAVLGERLFNITHQTNLPTVNLKSNQIK